MSWTETHRRWQAMQEIEALANAALSNPGIADDLPWNQEYAEIFGDRDGLAAALRYRWEQTRRAQLDTHLPESVLEEQWCRLHTRHAGVLRLLETHEARRRPGTSATDVIDRVPA
jgi:hypothetical protein